MWIDNRDFKQLMVKVDRILTKLGIIQLEGEINMALIDDVTAKVAAETTVIDSAVKLLGELKAALDAAGTDPVKLAALGDMITVNTNKLADAVVANTPTPPTP